MTPATMRRLLVLGLLLNLAILGLMSYDFFIRPLPLLVPWVVGLSLAIVAIAFIDVLGAQEDRDEAAAHEEAERGAEALMEMHA